MILNACSSLFLDMIMFLLQENFKEVKVKSMILFYFISFLLFIIFLCAKKEISFSAIWMECLGKFN